MPEENVEIVRRAVEAFNNAGLGSEEAIEFFDEAVVFEEPPEQPAPRLARGRESALEMFREFDRAWEEHHSDPEEIREIDSERILLLSIEHFRGRDGIVVDQPCGTIFTLADGKIVRMQPFWERESALKAAGLSN